MFQNCGSLPINDAYYSVFANSIALTVVSQDCYAIRHLKTGGNGIRGRTGRKRRRIQLKK